MFYKTLALEWFMAPQGAIKLLRASYWYFLDSPLHFQLQKVEVELIGWLLKAMRLGKTVLSLIEKVNKNYRLPFERVYGWTRMNNQHFRK